MWAEMGETTQTIRLHYDVPGDDFTRAGEASSAVKRTLSSLGSIRTSSAG